MPFGQRLSVLGNTWSASAVISITIREYFQILLNVLQITANISSQNNLLVFFFCSQYLDLKNLRLDSNIYCQMVKLWFNLEKEAPYDFPCPQIITYKVRPHTLFPNSSFRASHSSILQATSHDYFTCYVIMLHVSVHFYLSSPGNNFTTHF